VSLRHFVHRSLQHLAPGLVLAIFVAAGGCATGDESGAVTYSLTAKQNYDRGLEELKDENYPEAQKYFAFVKQKFPFSKYAVLAELALADTKFARGDYQEAADAYKTFMRLHPTHENVEDGYVAFRIVKCYAEEMPDDWFLVPPAAEKDQTAVRDAYRELSDFVDKFPDSKYLAEAKTLRSEVLRRLIEHEVYVARFYLDTDHPKAAVIRLETALRRYPESGREAELLIALGQTHLEMGNPLRAKQTFSRVVSDFGSQPQARRAQLFLEFIRGRYGDSPQDKPAPEGGRQESAPQGLSPAAPRGPARG
jgi:outer membrane protein assembly factor BamD